MTISKLRFTEEAQLAVDAAMCGTDVTVPAHWKGVGFTLRVDEIENGLVLYLCRPGSEAAIGDTNRPLMVEGVGLVEVDDYVYAVMTWKEVGEVVSGKIQDNQRQIEWLQKRNKELQEKRKEVCKKLGILK